MRPDLRRMSKGRVVYMLKTHVRPRSLGKVTKSGLIDLCSVTKVDTQ